MQTANSRRSRRPRLLSILLIVGMFAVSLNAFGAPGKSDRRPGRLEGDDLSDAALSDNSDIPEGTVVIQGDILIPEAALYSRGTYATNLWTNGIVPYEFNANVNATNQQRALDAMAEWEAVANVDFVVRSTETNYVHIQDSNGNGNNSYIGMIGGQQIINIESWEFEFIIAHEFGHALGFWHEHTRSDRGTFVDINTGNIQSGFASNFDVRMNLGPFGSDEYGPYDFDSVMHYSRCAFSIDCPSGSTCGCDPAYETITVLSPNDTEWANAIGQRTHLSEMDGLTMSFLYPESNWRFADENYSGTQTGSFLQPYTSFASGESNTPTNGTLWVQPGEYYAVGTYDTPMTISAPLGGVVLGD